MRPDTALVAKAVKGVMRHKKGCQLRPVTGAAVADLQAQTQRGCSLIDDLAHHIARGTAG
jgi:hypothetical protein